MTFSFSFIFFFLSFFAKYSLEFIHILVQGGEIKLILIFSVKAKVRISKTYKIQIDVFISFTLGEGEN